MVRDEFGVLAAFVAVAEERSFTRAAKRLGVSPSALSHAIRGLEERIGVRLLARTTRSVAPTEAGEQLFTRVRPAFGDIHQALDQVSGLRDRPAGRVRLLLPRSAAIIALVPKLAQFARDYPEVVLDVTTDNSRVDLVAAGFDAGIEIGEFIQKDMVAVRVSKDLRAAIVGSPKYFASHPKPKHPRDLLNHACINFRQGSRGVYRWEFEKGKQSLSRRGRRPADRRRCRDPRAGGSRRNRCGLDVGALRGTLHLRWQAGAGARGLVPAVPRLLPLLSEPTTATRRAVRVDQDASIAGVDFRTVTRRPRLPLSGAAVPRSLGRDRTSRVDRWHCILPRLPTMDERIIVTARIGRSLAS